MTALTPIRRSAPQPQPTWHRAVLLKHRAISDNHRFLRIEAPSIAAHARPGQFVMLTIARGSGHEPVLPRPMAIYRRDPELGAIEIVYGVIGDGTKRLSEFRVGERILVVGPLGQGFEVPDRGRLLLVGRGIGTCSLTTVAEDHPGVVAVASARTPDSLIGPEVYRACGADRVYEVTDVAGTSSVDRLRARLLADLAAAPPQQILTCGSQRLAQLCRELGDRWGAGVQVSVEAHMACGLGYCHGCADGEKESAAESPLICVDGPVFRLRREDR